MATTLEDKLKNLKYRSTAYELVARKGEEVRTIAYCVSRSRSTILRVAYKHGERLAALAGTDILTFGTRAKDGATIGDWHITFTGRTQREAYIEGEHPML